MIPRTRVDGFLSGDTPVSITVHPTATNGRMRVTFNYNHQIVREFSLDAANASALGVALLSGARPHD